MALMLMRRRRDLAGLLTEKCSALVCKGATACVLTDDDWSGTTVFDSETEVRAT